ncbi:MAG: hypothetical protein Q9191_007715 [Dirinaria sp. TL-2023a]
MAPLRLLFPIAALFFEMSHCSVAAISEIGAADWAALNASVNGRLFTLRPMAYPCYTSYNGVAKPVDKQACAEISAKKTNGNWGVCQATNAGCPISPVAGQNGEIKGDCVQGSVADFYIDVQAVSQVEEALKFANKNGIQVVVKNSGHDYLGRSTAPHSLALWMHNLQPPIKLAEKFVPEGCKDAVGKVVTFGAGQQWGGIYKFADAKNVTVLGGSSATVGAAGGWITGGGHGMLSPVFGLGVDNVQQFKVVLPNGTSVTANRCKNPDVFFALRGGGGGGTFGVITEMSTTAHEQVTLQYAKIDLRSLNKPQLRDFLKVLAANSNRWVAGGWGGDSYPISKRSIRLVNPLLNSNAAALSLKPLIDFANSLPKQGKVTMTTYPSWYQFYEANLASDYANSGNWGTIMSSRLIPASNFEGTQNQDQLVDAILTGAETDAGSPMIYPMLCMSTPVRTPDDGSALTPAWRKSTWHVMFITQWDPAQTTAEKIRTAFVSVHKAMDPLRTLTPSTGVYLNEADILEVDSPPLIWGPQKYQRLLKIKGELDPNKVLQVRGGVGSDPTARIFECYPKTEATPMFHEQLK